MKKIFKRMLVMGALAMSQLVLAETTLVLDLEEQFNNKAVAIRDYVNNQMTQQRIHDLRSQSKQELHRFKKAKAGAEKNAAMAKYVNSRVTQTSEELERIGRLYDLNKDLLGVADRLVSAYGKDTAKGKQASVSPETRRQVEQAVHATAIGIQSVLDSGVLRAEDAKYAKVLIRNTMSKLHKTTRRGNDFLHRLNKLRSTQDVLVSQLMVLEMMKIRLVDRLQRLKELNLKTRFATVTRQTDKVLREIGIFDGGYSKEDEELDREEEAMLYGAWEVEQSLSDDEGNDWSALISEMDAKFNH